MTAHHQGAIEMARIAQTRAEHAEIRELADDIVDAQQGEISVMKTIRRDMHDMGQHGDGSHGHERQRHGHGHGPGRCSRTPSRSTARSST